MRHYCSSISFAALFMLFCGGAQARNFSCMETAYKGAHQILSWEQYQTCMSVHFPALEADYADYEAQANKFRALKQQAAAYRPAAEGGAPDEVPADTPLINLPEHKPSLTVCESEGVREVMIQAAPFLGGLDKGIAYYNHFDNILLFKHGRFYAAYLPLCGAAKIVLTGDADLEPYKEMQAAASAAP